MSTPTIPDLPVATIVNDTDQIIIRQPAGGLGTDKSATATQLRDLNISGLGTTPTSPQNSDLMLIEQAGLNYQIRFDQVSFVAGTKMWFSQNVAPSGWTVVSSGDTLLAVKGGSVYTAGGSQQGDWMQTGYALKVEEIAPHRHRTRKTKSSTESSNSLGPRRGKVVEDDATVAKRYSTSDSTGGQGSTENIGAGNPASPHNHGDLWRPRASVGVICNKNK